MKKEFFGVNLEDQRPVSYYCDNLIQFNSIQFIYVQNLTAQRPITKLAQARKWEE
jgi:hypothetical protein